MTPSSGRGTDSYLGHKANSVRNYLLQEVASGRFASTEPLPPEAKLASTFGVCRNTVRRAFLDLEKQGVIHRIRGKGTFVTPRPAEQRAAQLAAFALIIPEVRRSLYPSLVRGFGRGAGEGNHQVLVCQTDNSVGKQADIILQLLDKRVAGVAIVPTTVPETPPYQIRTLQEQGIPVVFCHRSIPGVAAPCISWDWAEVGRIAGRLLLEHGHRRIGFFSMTAKYSASEAYAAGLDEVLDEADVRVAPAHRYFGTSDADAARRAWADLFQGAAAPTAVLCHDEICAEELYMFAAQHGIRVPGDLSIIGVGDASREGALRQRLSCVTIDEDRLGRSAAALLLQLASADASDDCAPRADRILVPLGLNKGETVGQV